VSLRHCGIGKKSDAPLRRRNRSGEDTLDQSARLELYFHVLLIISPNLGPELAPFLFEHLINFHSDSLEANRELKNRKNAEKMAIRVEGSSPREFDAS